MTLEYITEYIDKKIYKNDKIITVTFYELRIKEDLSKEDTYIFLNMSAQRLVNLGYKIYSTGERYIFDGKEKLVRSNVLFVAIKEWYYKFSIILRKGVVFKLRLFCY